MSRRPDIRGRRAATVTALSVLALLLLTALPGPGAASAPGAPASVPSLLRPLKIHDDENVTHLLGVVLGVLRDTLTTASVPTPVRSYTVHLAASIPIPGLAIELQTAPLSSWAVPGQFPYGPDNLPPLSEWTWWVYSGSGVNDTANWNVDPDGVHLDRTGTWGTRSYTIYGVSDPVVTLRVDPGRSDGATATGTGFVLNAPGYTESIPSTPGYPHLAAGVHPALVRICIGIPGALTGWNATSGLPVFNFKGLDEEFQFVEGLGAGVVLSFPAGTWGDGNTLPVGTPLNRSLKLSDLGFTGYFPSRAAMYSIVRGVANHTHAANESVAYWSIGNEVPLYSTAEAIAFATVINTAIAALHPLYPKARVGADDLLMDGWLPVFARHAPGIGFLSFHYYPEWAMCRTPSGAYCAPTGGADGLTDAELFAHPAFVDSSRQITPLAAVSAWRNATGRTIPVILTETNMASSGGIGTVSQTFGTDPRQQTLVGAAWLGALLVDASEEGVAGITFFGLTSAGGFPPTQTSPYGGFGFGLSNESPTGVTTRFAPYWAMSLWGRFLPSGAPGVRIVDPSPGVVQAFAVHRGGHVDVAIVNQVSLNVTVRLDLAGNQVLKSTHVLDDRSYVETYDPLLHSTSVTASGVAVTSAPKSRDVTLHGYGVAIAVFGHATTHPSPERADPVPGAAAIAPVGGTLERSGPSPGAPAPTPAPLVAAARAPRDDAR